MRTLDAFAGAALAWLEIPASPDPTRLSDAERAVFDAHQRPERRAEWWAGRVACHAALEALGAGRLSVLPDPRGLPVLSGDGAEQLFVSITHGRRIAAAVASRRDARFPAVGVDVVDREDGDRIQKLSARVLTPHEKDLITGDARIALYAWGTREAVAKATSTGMFVYALAGAPLTSVDAARGRITTDLEGIEVAYQDTADGGALVLAGASIEAIRRAQAKAGLAST